MSDARPDPSLAEIMIRVVDGIDKLNARLGELEEWAVSLGYRPNWP